jgi:chemotaxis protein histidine kinase CheA
VSCRNVSNSLVPWLDRNINCRVGSGEDFIGGLSNAIIGLKKGEKAMFGVSPRLAYTSSGADMNNRKRPGSWVVVEVEIVKVKSESSKEKKKEKKEKSSTAHEEDHSHAQTQQPAAPQQSPGSPQSDVTARMAKLSAQGGGQRMAPVVTGTDLRRSFHENDPQYQQQQQQQQQHHHHHQPAQEYAQQQQQQQQQQPPQQNYSQPPQQHQQHQQQAYQQQAPQQQHSQQPQQQQQQQQQHHPHQQQQHNNSNQYAVALVEGQGVRSYYADNNFNNNNFGQQNNPYQNQYPGNQSNLYKAPNIFNSGSSGNNAFGSNQNGINNSPSGGKLSDQQFAQLQQMLSQLQTGVVQV